MTRLHNLGEQAPTDPLSLAVIGLLGLGVTTLYLLRSANRWLSGFF